MPISKLITDLQESLDACRTDGLAKVEKLCHSVLLHSDGTTSKPDLAGFVDGLQIRLKAWEGLLNLGKEMFTEENITRENITPEDEAKYEDALYLCRDSAFAWLYIDQ